jgi:hypothetical protein
LAVTHSLKVSPLDEGSLLRILSSHIGCPIRETGFIRTGRATADRLGANQDLEAQDETELEIPRYFGGFAINGVPGNCPGTDILGCAPAEARG